MKPRSLKTAAEYRRRNEKLDGVGGIVESMARRRVGARHQQARVGQFLQNQRQDFALNQSSAT